MFGTYRASATKKLVSTNKFRIPRYTEVITNTMTLDLARRLRCEWDQFQPKAQDETIRMVAARVQAPGLLFFWDERPEMRSEHPKPHVPEGGTWGTRQ